MNLLKLIPDYPGYAASDDGKIWSRHNNRWGLGNTWRELRPGTQNTYGRQLVVLKHESGDLRPRYVHQLVLEAFCGPCPPGHESRHVNGKAGDNRSENLAWGTRKENIADMRLHGRSKGERHHRSVLTDDDIRVIRQRVRAGEIHEVIARDFPVNRRQVSRIAQGTRWAHVLD